LRFAYPEAGLGVASVGPILILAGRPERRAPFAITQLTILVRSLAAEEDLLEAGAEIIAPRKRVRTGWNMRARHPDGLVAEYVEHDAGQLAGKPLR
jgi:hypothetical protein